MVHEFALDAISSPFQPAKTDNRWNTAEVQVAYASEHLALAALELLTYWGSYTNMRGYQLFTMELDSENIEELSQASGLDPEDYEQTRLLGDIWAQEERSLGLKVPSVVVPMSYNYLINPAHSAFNSASIIHHGTFSYDARIARLVEQARTLDSWLWLSE